MKYSELKNILNANGCYIDREGGNHEWWYSPLTSRQFAVGRHDKQEVPTGTCNAILKQAGVKGGKK
jgi:predicted RNA binding protein YcfA (HicA-like mRNA interferase family)